MQSGVPCSHNMYPCPPLLVSSVSSEAARTVLALRKTAHGAQSPFSINPLPHTIKAVQVKHSEGMSVGHCGALQLWNGGALTCRGREDQATGALDTKDIMSRQ